MKSLFTFHKKCAIIFFLCILFIPARPLFSSNQCETVTIQLKWFHQFQFAGYYAAIEKGFYEQEGLHVILKERNPNKGHIQSVLDGDAEYGVADAGLLLDRMLGKPVVLLKQIFQHSPLIFVTLKKSKIISPYDMQGKKIMLDSEGHSNTPLVALLLETTGNLNSITLVKQSFNTDALLTGQVDAMSAYITDLPYALQKQNIPINIINPQNYGIDFYGDNFFTTETEIIKNPQRVDKMIRATLKGWEYALKNQDEIITLICNKYNPKITSDELYFEAQMTDLMVLSEIIPLGSVTGHRYKAVAEIYKNTGIDIIDNNLQNFIYENSDFLSTGFDLQLSMKEKNWIKKNPEVIIAFDGDYAPYSFKNKQNTFEGIAVDYANELSHRTGLTFKIHPEGVWKTLYQDALEDKVDVIASLMIRTDRLKDFNITQPYISLSYYIITRKSNKDIIHRENIQNKTIALVDGYASTESIMNEFPHIKQFKAKTLTSALFAVSSGKADAVVIAMGMAQHLIAQHNIVNLKFAAPYAHGMFEQGFGIRKNLPELASILDKALQSISNDERIHIFNRWSKLEIAKEETVLLGKVQKIQLTSEEKQWIANHPVIRVVSSSRWAPVEFSDNDDHEEFKGIAIDYLQRISKMFNMEFDFKHVDSWSECMEMLNNRDIDMIPAIAEKVDRKVYASFTKPYLSLQTAIFTLNDISYIQTPEELFHQKVVIVGYAIDKYLMDKYPEIQFVKAESILEALRMVQHKSVFAYVGSIFVTSHYIKQVGYNNLKISGYLDYKYDVAMAARNDWPMLTNLLQKGMDAIEKSEKDSIYKSWVSLNYEEKNYASLIWKLILGAGMIFFLFAIWNRILSKQVKERKRAEQEAKDSQASMMVVMQDLNAAKNKAEEAALAKSVFIANISHEIRTPMNAVLGFIDLVLDRKDILKDTRKNLTIARESAAALLSLINEILDLSKAESGKLILENKAFNIDYLIHRILNTIQEKAHEKDLYIHYDIDPQVPDVVMGDPLRLRQVLINLIGNAIKFTEQGGINIHVKNTHENHFIIFSVKDTGVGIPGDRLNVIFNPFEQADPSITRRYSGTGLGTTISKHLVELMGGNIGVESTPGQGSNFHFTVYLPETNRNPEKDLFGVAHSIVKKSHHKFHVLLVEDTAANVKLALSRLEKQGHTVDHAWNGRDAIQQLQIQKYDIVLMDIQMPIMDGLEATKRIRQMGWIDVPIIALTARLYQQEKQNYLDAGMNNVVGKPINFNELFATMEKYVLKDHKESFVPPVETEKNFNATEFPDIEGINFAEGMERFEDWNFYTRELIDFSKNYASVADDIQTALTEGDYPAVTAIAHRLKGLSGNLSITSVFHLASDINDKIINNEHEPAQSLIPLLQKTMEDMALPIQNLAPVTETSVFPEKKSDVDALKKVLTDIQHAIDRYDIDSVEYKFEELKLFFTDHEMVKLAKDIRDYDYDGAFAEVQRFIDSI
ncbi:MAG: transporter substrate-binding domain-containing protein [Candidatus Magnetomorum sp.]|nr:transporter substrate-binding domain-containing protein [Candidatus Magnetomorum sp.]